MWAQWRTVEARFGKLTRKERILVSLAFAAFVYIALDVIFVSPAEARRKKAVQEAAQKRQEADKLAPVINELAAKQSADPDIVNRRRLEELQRQAQAVQQALLDQSAQMVPADQMSKLLERLLANHPRLELVSLKTLPQAAIELGKDAKPAAQQGAASRPQSAEAPRESAGASGVYRYGLELSIKGGYLDLLGYLRDIESLPGRVYWDRMDLTVNEFPVSTLKLTLYTLSFDRTWMKV